MSMNRFDGIEGFEELDSALSKLAQIDSPESLAAILGVPVERVLELESLDRDAQAEIVRDTPFMHRVNDTLNRLADSVVTGAK